jgi:hypothetical protein
MPERRKKYLSQEVEVLQKLLDSGLSDQLISSGCTDGGHGYLILTKYGFSLTKMLEKSKYK